MKINSYCFILIILLLTVFPSHVSAAEKIWLDKIVLKGQTSYTSAELIKSLNLPPEQEYEQELIQVIKERLNDFYIHKGYYFVQIEHTDIIPIDNRKVNLLFNISEGQSGYLTDLQFSGNRYYTSLKLKQLLDLHDLSLIKLTELPAIMNKILNLYTNRGYLFAQVSLDTLSLSENLLSAVININEGPLFSAEKYRIKGNKVTRPNTLLKISGLSQVRSISADFIIQAENNILKKPYIRKCNIAPIDAKTLSIEIEENKMTKIEGVFGLATSPNSNKRNLNGILNLQFLNLWGTDRALTLYWKKLKTDYQILELSYHESGLSKYPFSGDVSIQRTQQDSAWISMKTGLKLYYDAIYYKLGSDFYFETLYPDSHDEITKTKYRNISLFWEYYKTDYAPNPSSGLILRLKSGWLFTMNIAENKTIPVIELDGTSINRLAHKLVLATGVHYREISDKNLKPYEQYKMGGFRTLRGYNEDAFISWRLGWVNTELRYLMSRDARVYLLLDDGILQLDNDEIKTDLIGSGFGISFNTKLGIVSLSYAIPISPNQTLSINNGMLHLGLESSF